MKQLYSVGIILYYKHNDELKYLLLYSQAGCWDFPKGQMLPNETKQETAQRELLEETGLNAQLNNNFEEALSYSFLDANKETIYKTDYMLIGETIKLIVTLSDEHTAFEWLSAEDTLNKITYDDTRNLFKKAHEYILAHQ